MIIIILIVSAIFILITLKIEQKYRTEIIWFIFPEIKCIIIEKNEENLILSEIEKRMNKKIKKIKKLYQATIDGGNLLNFHFICDNIPNV